jgi:hypothetical protein
MIFNLYYLEVYMLSILKSLKLIPNYEIIYKYYYFIHLKSFHVAANYKKVNNLE